MDLTTSDLAKKLLIMHEDMRKYPYSDTTGNLTIGVGRNLTTKGISAKEMDFMLENDISDVVNELKDKLPCYNSLNSVRQAVLIDMGFNLGVAGLLGFSKTIDAISKGNFISASTLMLDSVWARQVGYRAAQLSKMLATGQML